MMDINRDNYEAWLLDLLEGSLSDQEVQEVRDFLLLNPDCAFGLDELEPWVLEAEKISFSGKAKLRKELPDHTSPVSEKDFDLFSIAMMEGDLSESQEEEYLRMLEGDEEKKKEWLLWKQMKLDGKTVLFEHKKGLKKRVAPSSRVIWISIASAAAALVLFFSLFRTDQGLNPSSLVPSEAEVQMESLPEQVEGENPDMIALSEEQATGNSAILASEPTILASEPKNITRERATFSIKKHQDPPELTGQKKDTGDLVVKEADLQERPLRMAMLEKGLIQQDLQGNYDRIDPLDLTHITVYSTQLFEDEYDDDGLGQSYREFVEKKNISLFSIASAGVKGINRLAGSDLSLNAAEDENGEVRGFRFRSGLLSVDSPGKKQNIPR
ncbi:MAG: hypothetical protein QNK35_15410 [Bacteroides sp.]|nr:hypothetical protein [Bacteroides sp.]